MPALEYTRVADLYDDYCVFAGDLELFRSLAATTNGRVLELMAGTGRVSLPLVEAGADLACVDIDHAMLAVLARKLRAVGRPAMLIRADVCRLPCRPGFTLALLPFQGLTELRSESEQQQLFLAVHRVLAPGGRFVCTSHNPPVRSRTIDGAWHEVGRFAVATGGMLRVSLRTELVGDGKRARGRQRLERLAADGTPIDVREVDLEFSLPAASAIVAFAEAAGFRRSSLLGDYAGSPFDEATSPVIIATFEKGR